MPKAPQTPPLKGWAKVAETIKANSKAPKRASSPGPSLHDRLNDLEALLKQKDSK